MNISLLNVIKNYLGIPSVTAISAAGDCGEDAGGASVSSGTCTFGRTLSFWMSTFNEPHSRKYCSMSCPSSKISEVLTRIFFLQDRIVDGEDTLPEISEKSVVCSGSGLVHGRFLKHVAMEFVLRMKLWLPKHAVPAAAGHSDPVNDTVYRCHWFFFLFIRSYVTKARQGWNFFDLTFFSCQKEFSIKFPGAQADELVGFSTRKYSSLSFPDLQPYSARPVLHLSALRFQLPPLELHAFCSHGQVRYSCSEYTNLSKYKEERSLIKIADQIQ